MDQDQAPRHDNPADPVVGTPEEVATAEEDDTPGNATPDVDLTAKADTTKGASIEPSD